MKNENEKLKKRDFNVTSQCNNLFLKSSTNNRRRHRCHYVSFASEDSVKVTELKKKKKKTRL